MADSGQQHGEDSQPKSRNSWIVAGAIGALGFEFVGFVLAGLLIGSQIDVYFDSEPVGLIVSVALALLAVGLHSYHVIQRFLKDGEE